MSPESNRRSFLRIAGALAVAVFAILTLGPTVGTPLRDADYIDIHLYSMHPIGEVFSTTHLRAQRVHFYRPLSDFVDALLVRSFGFQPASYHIVLLGLIVANACLLAALFHTWLPRSMPLGWIASFLYVAHPLQQGTLSYFEGGFAHVTYLFWALVFLHAASRWRRAESRRTLLGIVAYVSSVAAMFCFDGALVLPVVWVFVDLVGLFPGRVEHRWRDRWILLSSIAPVLLARVLVMGEALGGYGFPPIDRSMGLDYLMAFGLVISRHFYAAFDDVRALCSIPTLPPQLFFTGLGALAIACAWRDRKAFRAAGAAGLLMLGLIAPAMPDFVMDVVARGDLQPNGAYRSSVPIALSALMGAFLIAGAFGGRPWLTGGIVALWILHHVIPSVPLAQSCRHAGDVANAVRAGVMRHAPASDETAVLVVDTPIDVRLGSLSTMRVFQYGLASSLQPPCSDRRILAFPLLVDPTGLIARKGLVETLSERSDVSVVRWNGDDIEPWRSLGEWEKPPGIPLLEPADNSTLSLESPPPWCEKDGSGEGVGKGFLLSFDGSSLDKEMRPVVVVINRVHPFFLQHDPGHRDHLPLRVVGSRVDAWIGGSYLAEVLAHFPDDPLFLVLEMLGTGERVRARSEARCIRTIE